jgi:hypothetical protein
MFCDDSDDSAEAPAAAPAAHGGIAHSLAEAAAAPARRQACAPTCLAFAAAKAFCGSRPGTVFRIGLHGLGYYADVPRPAPHAEAAPAAIALDIHGVLADLLCPPAGGRPARARRPRRRPQRAHLPPCRASAARGGDTFAADDAHRRQGLWAFDLLNGGGIGTA